MKGKTVPVHRNFNKGNYKHRVLFGTPTTGVIRMEWHNAISQLIYPVNWSNSITQVPIPLGGPYEYLVADARNIIVNAFLKKDFEWLVFMDHDTEPPARALLTFSEYMDSYEVPVVAGLYYAKGDPAYPLIFRGRGNGAYCMEGGKAQWMVGDRVWCDGIPMGMTMIHKSIMEALANESEDYVITGNLDESGKPESIKQVFVTPKMSGKDPQNNRHFMRYSGTEDLPWCDRLINEEIFKKAGWSDIQKKEFPFLVDTNIFCWHRGEDGVSYPTNIDYTQALKKQGYL